METMLPTLAAAGQSFGVVAGLVVVVVAAILEAKGAAR